MDGVFKELRDLQRYLPHEHIEELSRIVFGHGLGFQAMAFFSVYFDASGAESNSPYLVLEYWQDISLQRISGKALLTSGLRSCVQRE